jgi:hypothetical protein
VNPVEVTGVLVAVLTSASIVFAGVRWLVRSFLWELKPNHGTSWRDLQDARLDRLESRVDEIYHFLLEKR